MGKRQSVAGVLLPTQASVHRFTEPVTDWYRAHGRRFPWRRRGLSQYRLVVTEILLQRTRAETVARFESSFFEAFPRWTALAEDQHGGLEEYLKPIGIWRRRAASLKALASEMVSRRGRFPGDRESVEALPAVGQYIANAILLLCKNQPEPLLDVNMARVLERYFGPRQLADIRYDPYLQRLSRCVVSAGDARTINWAILDLASMVCKARAPNCPACPLTKSCRFAAGVT